MTICGSEMVQFLVLTQYIYKFIPNVEQYFFLYVGKDDFYHLQNQILQILRQTKPETKTFDAMNTIAYRQLLVKYSNQQH